MFGWLKCEQRNRRKKVKLDRKHLESRARRFLTNYLATDETRKPRFYRAVEAASKKCHLTDLGVRSFGPVAELVGIRVGVVSGVINVESSGVEASDWRLRHEATYH